MDPESFYRWLIGVALTATGLCSGLLVTAYQMLTRRIEANSKATKIDDDAIHERINRVRDELARDFVRKADIEVHMGRIEASSRETRQEFRDAIKTINGRFDDLLKELRSKP